MCYNCGCGLPNDDMGKGHAGIDANGKSITNMTFKAAAEAFGMSEDQAKKEALALLKKQLGEN